MMHVCIPYSSLFEDQVLEYMKYFTPRYTVIHSTVPIGTSWKLRATHSPIRGSHPDLAESVRTFVKYVGGPDSKDVAIEFEKYGIQCRANLYQENTEAGKLFDLMQYGASILVEKEIHEYCLGKGFLNYDFIYRDFNETYNKGWAEMKRTEVIRPVLKHMPGKIGGHCVSQMMELLDSPTAKKIIEENNKLY